MLNLFWDIAVDFVIAVIAILIPLVLLAIFSTLRSIEKMMAEITDATDFLAREVFLIGHQDEIIDSSNERGEGH